MLTGDAGETSQACCGDTVLGIRDHAGLTGGSDVGSGLHARRSQLWARAASVQHLPA